MGKHVGRKQPNNVDDSAAFAFRATEDVLVVSHSVSKISKSSQGVVKRVSIGASREGFVEVWNPDGFLVSVHEEIRPETKHEFGDDLARQGWA
ncbi:MULTISPECIES: hypothetical protein [Cryobacterium]|uniref:Uncharacterized protein n=1 Tax=Cryobacterium breve TaxID=1259258 RepID=A0ABY2IVZ3_9MICO|nr:MULTISPECIES: hypothetical protein [Cryobacterium]TFC94405.1 hypothetical protein E3T20_07840 [Cryobacterium sp. TmT3-12]TFC95010.1 hypothetical protein E3O65_15730 [Cryobacterium breve]